MTQDRQRVHVKLPGIRQMPIIRATVHNVRKKGRAYVGEYQTAAGNTQKVWRTMASDTWRPLS